MKRPSGELDLGHFILMLLVLFFIGMNFLVANSWREKHAVLNEPAKQAVQECEAELPRNLHCEVVITAEVVSEDQ